MCNNNHNNQNKIKSVQRILVHQYPPLKFGPCPQGLKWGNCCCKSCKNAHVASSGKLLLHWTNTWVAATLPHLTRRLSNTATGSIMSCPWCVTPEGIWAWRDPAPTFFFRTEHEMCRECEHVGVMPVYKPLSLFLLTPEMDQNSVERASGNGECRHQNFNFI